MTLKNNLSSEHNKTHLLLRSLLPLLILLFVSCKNETTTDATTEDRIDQSVEFMWNNYIASHPQHKNEALPESWFFHNNETDANRLAKLTLEGKKQASSGLYDWYKEANANLPQVGKKHIITDFNGNAKAIIMVTDVDTIPFNKITADYASLDMGTQIDALKKWKKAHWDFFEITMAENGNKPSKNMLVVCERFKTIWPNTNEVKNH